MLYFYPPSLFPLIKDVDEIGAGRNLNYFKKDNYTRFFKLEQIFTVILMSNAVWNFFVYSLHVQEFRNNLRKLVLELKNSRCAAVCCRKATSEPRTSYPHETYELA